MINSRLLLILMYLLRLLLMDLILDFEIVQIKFWHRMENQFFLVKRIIAILLSLHLGAALQTRFADLAVETLESVEGLRIQVHRINRV